MQYKSVIAAALMVGAANAVTGKLGDAAPILDNPVNQTYVATFTTGAVTGFIRAVAGKDGKGVDFEVNIKTIMNKVPMPLGYHLHDAPVTTDCLSTLAHLDPYQRGQAEPCDKTKPETCEVGDLSGKHGTIYTIPFAASYNDLYASTKPGIGAFFGNRSVVVHANDPTKARVACANFVLEEPAEDKPAEEDSECEESDYESEEEEECEDEDGTPGVPGGPGHPDATKKPVVPGPAQTSSAPMVTSTLTVTAPCPICPGKTTVYLTTTVCPEGSIPTGGVPAVPSGPAGPGAPGAHPSAPAGHPEGPKETYVPGKPGGEKPAPSGPAGVPVPPKETAKGEVPAGKPEHTNGVVHPPYPIGTAPVPKPTGGYVSKNATSSASSSTRVSSTLKSTPTVTKPAEYEGAASAMGVSSGLALIGGIAALLAVF